MVIIYSIIVFIYGLLFGSFFNVVGYRLPNNLSIVSPGSFCPKCNHSLKWYELIPVFSFIFLKGRCHKCGCRISLFYPIIELLTGILFLISYLVFGFAIQFVFAILASSFFVIVVVSDFSYLIIPDEVTIVFSIASLVAHAFLGWQALINSMFGGLLLFTIIYVIRFLGNKAFKEDTLGGGDIKLMFFVGTFLTPFDGLFHIFLSSLLASPFAIFSYFSKKKRVIPFGPFLLFSLLVMILTKLDVIELLNYFTK